MLPYSDPSLDISGESHDAIEGIIVCKPRLLLMHICFVTSYLSDVRKHGNRF